MGRSPNLTGATVWQTGPIKGDRNGIKVLKCSLSSYTSQLSPFKKNSETNEFVPSKSWNSYLQVQKEKHLPNEHSTTKFCSECHGWTERRDFNCLMTWSPNRICSSYLWPHVSRHAQVNKQLIYEQAAKLSISMNKPTNLLHSSCPFPLKKDWINHQVCGPQQSQEPQDVGIMPKIKGHDLISAEFTLKKQNRGESHEILLTFTWGVLKTHLFIIRRFEVP